MGPSVWLIAGPTASGKSALALRLAERLGAEVVNADSMQLYAGLRVLTAGPTEDERRRRPHHLYGVADPAEAWSVGGWLRAARAVLRGLAARDRPAVVVGGTGLYFRALTMGLADIPNPSPDLREAVAGRLERDGEAAFRAELARADPVAAARIAPGDRQRLVRAASVLESSGRPLSFWQAATRPTLEPGRYAALVVEPPRPALYTRCDARLHEMIAGGALEEVAALLARRLAPELPAMKALGLRDLADHLEGRVDLAQAVEAAQRRTRQFAKRQLTWFRNQTPDWPRLDEAEPEERMRTFDAWAAAATPA